VRFLITGWRLLINCGLAGMLAGTAIAAGIRYGVATPRRSLATADVELWMNSLLQSLALVLVGGLLSLCWRLAHLAVEDLDAGTQNRLDYDDSIRRTCPPGST
jgi:hypothetical protein